MDKCVDRMILFLQCRAIAVGALAIGSKAAMFVKTAGGTGSLAKGVGLLVGGIAISMFISYF